MIGCHKGCRGSPPSTNSRQRDSCRLLQCIAVCCYSLLQYIVAVCCSLPSTNSRQRDSGSVLQCVAVCCSVLHGVAICCCHVLQYIVAGRCTAVAYQARTPVTTIVAVYCSMLLPRVAVHYCVYYSIMLHCVAPRQSKKNEFPSVRLLQCIAVCCSIVLQCVAMCCTAATYRARIPVSAIIDEKHFSPISPPPPPFPLLLIIRVGNLNAGRLQKFS